MPKPQAKAEPTAAAGFGNGRFGMNCAIQTKALMNRTAIIPQVMGL